MAGCTALLQSKKLLSAESLIVYLTGGFDQVLKVSAGEEVAEIDEFAVVFIFNVYHAPAVLTTADLLSNDNDRFLTADNSKRNDILGKNA